jgi:hypothetical protein
MGNWLTAADKWAVRLKKAKWAVRVTRDANARARKDARGVSNGGAEPQRATSTQIDSV